MEIEPFSEDYYKEPLEGLNPCYTGMEIEHAEKEALADDARLNPCYTGMEIERNLVFGKSINPES